MNVLNKYFNNVYVISSYTTHSRLSDLLPFLDNENIQYELIIAPKKKYFKPDYDKTLVNEGAQSLISANESIFLKEKFNKSDTFCIIEDDVFFVDNYIDKLSILFKKLPVDWDILNLGYHEHTPINFKLNENDVYYKLNVGEEIVGSHFIVYKQHVVQSLLDSIETCTVPMDWFLSKTICPNFSTYICTDKIFYQSSYRSYELDKNESYKKYKSEIE